MTLLDKFMIALGFQVDDSGLNKFEEDTTRIRGKALELADTVGGILTFAFGELFKGFVDTSAQFERFGVVLSVLYGSAAQGQQAMDWISKFAVTTPYQLTDLTQAFLRLKAFGLDPMNGSLKTVGDAAAAFGRPLMEAVYAVDDAVEGLNRPLRTFGISVKEAGNRVTYSYIKNGEMISKTADKNNKVMIASTLMAIWNDRYGGSMDKLSHTWIGMWSNLADQYTRFKWKVMNAGPFVALKDQVASLLNLVNKISTDGTTEQFATLFDVAFEMIIRPAKALYWILNGIITRTIGWKTTAVLLAAALGGVFLSSLAATVRMVWRLTASVLAFDASTVAIFAIAAALILIIDDLWNYYHGNESLIGQLKKKFPLAVEAAYAAIVLIIGAFVALKWTAISSLTETIAIMAMYAVEWAAAAASTLAGLASMVAGAAVAAVGWIASFGSMAVATIAATWPVLAVIAVLALLGFAVYELWKHWSTVTKAIHKAWTFVINELKAGINWLLNKAVELGDKAYNFIKLLPGGAKMLDYTARISGLPTAGGSISATLGNSVNASGGVIGRAGSSISTTHAHTIVTHHETVNAPITVVSNDPDQAGKSVNKVLGQKRRQVVRNGQSAVAY